MTFTSSHLSTVMTGIVISALWTADLQGQHQDAKQEPVKFEVPFVGCNSDGQVGPMAAPRGRIKSVHVTPEDGKRLAYYKWAQGVGALAPRGWSCFAIYGSGGESLYIMPQPINRAKIFSSGPRRYAGPGIQVDYTFGGTSGRFVVAEILARVFPAYRSIARKIIKDYPTASPLVFLRYPNDNLTYKSKSLAEYETPPQSEGLGTYAWRWKSPLPTMGAVKVVGRDPDVALLSVRLPIELRSLAAAIIEQFENDVARCPCE